MPPEKWETTEILPVEKPHRLHRLLYPALQPVKAVEHPVDEQVLPSRQLPVEVVLLGHDADEPLDLGGAGGVEARDRPGAGIGPRQEGQHLDKGCLSRPVRTEEAEDLSFSIVSVTPFTAVTAP